MLLVHARYFPLFGYLFSQSIRFDYEYWFYFLTKFISHRKEIRRNFHLVRGEVVEAPFSHLLKRSKSYTILLP